jgi:hypothetical protein
MHLPVIFVKSFLKCHPNLSDAGTPFSVPSPVSITLRGAFTVAVVWLHVRVTSPVGFTLTFAPQTEQL